MISIFLCFFLSFWFLLEGERREKFGTYEDDE